MGQLQITCPKCGQRTLVDAVTAGAARKCLRCGQLLVIHPPPGGKGPGPANAPPLHPAASPAQPPRPAGPSPPVGSKPFVMLSCQCGRQYRISATHSGKHGKCPACGAELVVPAGPPRAEPTAAPGAAQPATAPPMPEPIAAPLTAPPHLDGAAAPSPHGAMPVDAAAVIPDILEDHAAAESDDLSAPLGPAIRRRRPSLSRSHPILVGALAVAVVIVLGGLGFLLGRVSSRAPREPTRPAVIHPVGRPAPPPASMPAEPESRPAPVRP